MIRRTFCVGCVALVAAVSSAAPRHAFVSLPDEAGRSHAYDVVFDASAGGVLVGGSALRTSGITQAAYWRQVLGGGYNLNFLPDAGGNASEVRAVDASSFFAGSAEDSLGNELPTYWFNDGFEFIRVGLGTLGGNEGRVNSIARAGTLSSSDYILVGESQDVDGNMRPTMWLVDRTSGEPLATFDLGTLGGSTGRANDVARLADGNFLIVGSSATTDGAEVPTLFLASQSGLVGVIAGDSATGAFSSVASSSDNSGFVAVGTRTGGLGAEPIFYRYNGSAPTVNFLAASLGLSSLSVTGVNDTGIALGVGLDGLNMADGVMWNQNPDNGDVWTSTRAFRLYSATPTSQSIHYFSRSRNVYPTFGGAAGWYLDNGVGEPRAFALVPTTTNMPNWLTGADAFRPTALGYAGDGEVQTALPNVDNDAIVGLTYLGQTPDYATSVRLTARLNSGTVTARQLKGSLSAFVLNRSTGAYTRVERGVTLDGDTATVIINLGSSPTTYVSADGKRRVDVRLEVSGPRKSTDWQLVIDEAVLIPTPPSTKGNK